MELDFPILESFVAKIQRLPEFESAEIPPAKLRDYALNPASIEGSHKAFVFENALGIEQENWEYLRDGILEGLPLTEAILAEPETPWGHESWTVHVPILGLNRCTRLVTTGWKRLPGTPPSLTTAYIKSSRQNRLLQRADFLARSPHRTPSTPFASMPPNWDAAERLTTAAA
jgi:hypothetical protein